MASHNVNWLWYGLCTVVETSGANAGKRCNRTNGNRCVGLCRFHLGKFGLGPEVADTIYTLDTPTHYDDSNEEDLTEIIKNILKINLNK